MTMSTTRSASVASNYIVNVREVIIGISEGKLQRTPMVLDGTHDANEVPCPSSILGAVLAVCRGDTSSVVCALIAA